MARGVPLLETFLKSKQWLRGGVPCPHGLVDKCLLDGGVDIRTLLGGKGTMIHVYLRHVPIMSP